MTRELFNLNLCWQGKSEMAAGHLDNAQLWYLAAYNQACNFVFDNSNITSSEQYNENVGILYVELHESASSVSIVSGYGLDNRAIKVRSPAEAKEFFL
jgi:hypothetical protein